MTPTPPQWLELSHLTDIEALAAASFDIPCIIFKHSPKCTTSLMKQYTLSIEWPFAPEEARAYLVDVVQHPDVAAAISDFFSEHHQSPQVLVIHQGACVYEESHLDINAEELADNLLNDW